MSAEIISFRRWHRCDCRLCGAIAEAWNEDGGPTRSSLDAFLVEQGHPLRPYYCSSAALRIIARQGSPLSRSLAKGILKRAWLLRSSRNHHGDGGGPDAA
jgi:hypothetical protein